MNFVSYAQNFEDVMLWRAFKTVENGFYIDIGAQDPVVDSVSLAFYEHGWRGVHVEPTQQYSNKLRSARPDETVLQIAIGNQSGTLTFYEFEDTGLSTADVDIARRHQEEGFHCKETLVSVITLDALLERIGNQEVHWLKLDVEGLEKAVLESWQISSTLPWILVIESTRPLTQQESHDEWEQLILNKGYQYVYFDGLNRFYVSPYHADLANAFNSPPNVFDGFVLSGTASQPFYKLVEEKAQQSEVKAQHAETKAQQAEEKAQQAEVKAQHAETKAQQAEEKAQQAEEKAQQAEEKAQQAEVKAQQAELKAQQAELKAQQAEVKAQQAEVKAERSEQTLHDILSSRSWRVTKPLRLAGQLARWFERGMIAWLTFAPQSRPRRTLCFALMHFKLYVSQRPSLKRVLLTCLQPFPRLKSRLQQVGAEPFVQTYTDTVAVGPFHDPRLAKLEKLVASVINEIRKEQS